MYHTYYQIHLEQLLHLQISIFPMPTCILFHCDYAHHYYYQFVRDDQLQSISIPAYVHKQLMHATRRRISMKESIVVASSIFVNISIYTKRLQHVDICRSQNHNLTFRLLITLRYESCKPVYLPINAIFTSSVNPSKR